VINYFFRSPDEQKIVKNNYLASFIEEAGIRFQEEEIPKDFRVKNKLYGIVNFGNWLQKKRIPVEKIDLSHANKFLAEFPRISNAHKVAFVYQGFAARLIVKAVREKYPSTEKSHIEVAKYLEHLHTSRGLKERSCRIYKPFLLDFLSHFFSKKKTVAVSSLNSKHIQDYIQHCIPKMSESRTKTMCGTLRGYFRFLEFQGIDTRHLLRAIPCISFPRRSLSPHILTTDDLNKLLKSIDRSSCRITTGALFHQVKHHWKKSGLSEMYSGTHIFRHSLASHLRCKGLSLKSIADILGHQSLDTTALYAQVDIPTLRQVTQSWPKRRGVR